MKKILMVLLCFVISLSFVGCKNTEKQNNEARELLQKVLEKEQSFTFKSLVFDKVTEESLEKFSFPTEVSAINRFAPLGYSYIDFDSDGIEELLIVDVELQFFLILKYDDGNVNGYILDDMSLQGIKTDGSFLTVRYDSYTAISRVSFEGLNCEVSYLAYKGDSTNTYQLKGKPATKEEVESYFDEWNENTTKISWITIE